MLSIKKIVKSVFCTNRNIGFELKQEAMLYIALCEIGINPAAVRLSIDHVNGSATVSGVSLGLIFPSIFFDVAKSFHTNIKDLEYYFDGYVGDDGGRRDMLMPFARRKASINFSDTGRQLRSKGAINHEYIRNLARAKFSLCPHQIDWPHPNSTIWTYRFVEACMAGSIPVVFRATPLSPSFTSGIKFVFDDQALRDPGSIDISMFKGNFETARRRFTISADQAKDIYRRGGL